MLDELQLRSVARDDAPHEDNLLIEAVSLLVQRQRETETWVAEQVDQAEERAAAVEQRYAELEGRLAGIEFQLDRLVRELEPGRGDVASGQQLARLREQVEDLKSDTDGRPPRASRSAAAVVPSRSVEPAPPTPTAVPATVGATITSTLDLFGATPQDRFGILLMFLGIVAVLYAVLMLLRF
jgi:hypothetical protein